MYSKPLTTLQHKANKKNKKLMDTKEKKRMCKKEIKILEKIRGLPEEIASYIYSFVDNDIKFNLSHYKSLFTKYIYDFNNKKTKHNLHGLFKGYPEFNYCTFYNTDSLLKELLFKIPFEKLEKFTLFGTPSKYFNIAFPYEPTIKEYMEANYKKKAKKCEDIEFQRKNYIFEILDLLIYFSTKANEWYAFHSKYNNKYLSELNFLNSVFNYDTYNQQTEEYCRENEMIFKRIILSIIHINL